MSEAGESSVDDTATSFGNNPTKEVLAEGILELLKPTVEQLEDRVKATRISQVELSRHLEGLAEELRKISDSQPIPIDLDDYTKRLTDTRHRVTVIQNILQTVQERLNRINSGIGKETSKRRAFVDQSLVSTPS